MKERPIFMSGPMVRAILEERKSQTRRVIKRFCEPLHPIAEVHQDGGGNWIGWWPGSPGLAEFTKQAYPNGGGVKCPYGVPGDRLWLRETHTWVTLAEKDTWKERAIQDGTFKRTDKGDPVKMCYRADGYEIPAKWRSSMFMPRWASRITLEITEVRVQQAQDISEEDAIAEGIYSNSLYGDDVFHWEDKDSGYMTAKTAFCMLWDSINGKKHSWESNPWVWAISFRKVQQ